MSRLGKFRRSFGRPAESRILPVLGVPMVAGGVYTLAGAIGLVPLDNDFLNDEFTGVKGFLGSLILLGCGVLSVWLWAQSKLGRVRLYDNGIVVGGKRIHFDDIEAVIGAVEFRERGVPRFAALPGRLALADGHEVTLPDRLHIDAHLLYRRLHDAAGRSARPAAEAAIADDGEATFGPLRVSRDGLWLNRNTLPWQDLAGFSLDDPADPESLMIHQAGRAVPWGELELTRVPNCQLALEMCRQRAAAAGTNPTLFGECAAIDLPPLRRDDERPAPKATPRRRRPDHGRRSVHTASWASSLSEGFWRIPALLVILGGMIGLLFAGVALFTTPARGKEMYAVVPIAGGAAAVILGCVVPIFRIRSVTVNVDGIAWFGVGRRGDYLWRDVRRYQFSDVKVRNATTGTATRNAGLVLRFKDGTKFRIDTAFSDFDDLAWAAIRSATAAMLPAARDKLQKGLKFAAGRGDMATATSKAPPIWLTGDGVRVGRRQREWPNLERVWLGDGVIGWEFRGGSTAQTPLEAVPNFGVMLELVRERIGDQCEAPAMI